MDKISALSLADLRAVNDMFTKTRIAAGDKLLEYGGRRYIRSVWRLRNGGLEINGEVGTRVYYDYPRREAITRYNSEAKASRKGA